MAWSCEGDRIDREIYKLDRGKFDQSDNDMIEDATRVIVMAWVVCLRMVPLIDPSKLALHVSATQWNSLFLVNEANPSAN